MKDTLKNFKDKLIGKKGLLSIGFADIVGSGVSGLFWLYIASQLNPDVLEN